MSLKNRLVSRLFPSLLASTLTLCMGSIAAWGQTSALDAMARVSAHPDLSVRTRLAGHVPAWAAAAQDLGAVADGLLLDHVTVTLTRPAALEAAFQQLLRDQQDASSPRYHQWLTPQQSATLYGVPQADSDAVAAWLTSEGLRVDAVSPTRQFITVSGAASAVSNAFGVQLHRFNRMGRTVFSITSEPAVPAALAGVIQGVAGLSEEYLQPVHTLLPPQPLRTAGNSITPDVNVTSSTHWLLPADFSVIYDVTPVYNAGITGTGQHVAIIAGSRVLPADITSFEGLAGLASARPNSLLTPGSTDPGMTSNSSQGEATLDVDRVIGTAPGATADLVLISSLLNTQILSSLSYIINTLNDPIINMSFGSCEAASSQSSFNSFNTLFAQAAGQGISIFVSSGDSEAAGCMTAGAAYNTTPAYEIASTNVLCTPYVTCVGGTQFSDTANTALYWSTSNGTNNVSALSYIPEGVWNEPTSIANGVTSYVVAGGGGGASIFATKPTWQSGTGVPADNARDTPDVSFSASGHNAYLACLAYSGASCQPVSGQTGVQVTGFGGTSASAPSMAGIVALVNQKTGVRQGLFNAELYQLALTPSNGVFHDATPATSGVSACAITTASTCNTSTPGSAGLTGGVQGAALTTGYDLATGLGSIDVAKLMTAVISVTTSPSFVVSSIPSTTVASGTAATFSATYTAVNGFSGTITPACTVTSTFTSPVPPVCSAPAVTLGGTATTASATFTVTTTKHNASPGSGALAESLPARSAVGGVLLSALLLCLIPRRRMKSVWSALPLVLLLAGTLLGAAGCGGATSSASVAVQPVGTTAGSYNVTIVSTGGGVSVTTITTIVVQ